MHFRSKQTNKVSYYFAHYYQQGTKASLKLPFELALSFIAILNITLRIYHTFC